VPFFTTVQHIHPKLITVDSGPTWCPFWCWNAWVSFLPFWTNEKALNSNDRKAFVKYR